MLPLGGNGFQHPSDTVDLQEIAVYGSDLGKYAVGQQVLTFDKKLIMDFSGRSLGDLLQQSSGLYLRQYGEGMVASMTIRGTSAGHTAVFWNGLPVNSPSLGQTDFSLLPNEAIGKLAVHYGSSGALYGSDAIGGSVHLNSELKFNQGYQLQVRQGIGSFGRFNTGISFGYSDQQWTTHTKLYRNFSHNDFIYRDPTRPGLPEARTQNAAVKQIGLLQDLGLNINGSSQVSTSIWYNTTDRQIQPLMGSNSQEVQDDSHLRWVLDYYHFGGPHTWNLKLGWVRDHMIFNRNSTNETNQYFLSAEYEWSLGAKLSTKLGSRYTQMVGDLSTYSATENRIELFSSTTFRPVERLGLSVNLRQMAFDQEWVPFTPSASAQYEILQHENEQLAFKAAVSKSYKIPTLNDRFWVPGGNPSLIPEKGTSWETGLTYQKKINGRGTLISEVTYYNMDVENWIIWLPQGNIWSPSNIRNVKNQGLEVATEANYTMGELQLKANLHYAYNQARNQTRINTNDRSFGKQLPYTPLHKIQWNVRVQRNVFEWSINQVHTGERYDTSDNESVVAPFTLWNSGIQYNWTYQQFSGNLGMQVLNLMNEQYQTMKLRAMPGRNYLVSLNINL
jgi:iron complex outermembrane receptor protein